MKHKHDLTRARAQAMFGHSAQMQNKQKIFKLGRRGSAIMESFRQKKEDILRKGNYLSRLVVVVGSSMSIITSSSSSHRSW